MTNIVVVKLLSFCGSLSQVFTVSEALILIFTPAKRVAAFFRVSPYVVTDPGSLLLGSPCMVLQSELG